MKRLSLDNGIYLYYDKQQDIIARENQAQREKALWRTCEKYFIFNLNILLNLFGIIQILLLYWQNKKMYIYDYYIHG